MSLRPILNGGEEPTLWKDTTDVLRERLRVSGWDRRERDVYALLLQRISTVLLLASEGTGGALGILLLQVPLPEVNLISDTSNIFRLSAVWSHSPLGSERAKVTLLLVWNTLECWKVR